MKRLLPSPLLSASLWALWLLLNDSIASAQVVFGLFLAVVVPLWIGPLKPPGPRLHHPVLLTRLIFRVGGDVVVSALDVAHGVLRSSKRPPVGTFVAVPLELDDPHALAALAVITAVIPGTVWSELSADRRTLLLHVFDLDDEAAFIERFTTRYVQPLREIFG